MRQLGVIATLQVGVPHDRPLPAALRDAPEEATWRSSFTREPSPERRWLHTTHLDGNQQADTKNHGQLSQTVLLYADAHYPRWREELGRPEMGPGGFAENLTVTEMDESAACIGDVYALGDALIQVTAPRYPCANNDRRWGIPDLRARVAATGRTGWYCQTNREGWLAPGMPIMLAARPYPRWTVALLNDLGHGRNHDVALADDVAACPALDHFWGDLVRRMARKAN